MCLVSNDLLLKGLDVLQGVLSVALYFGINYKLICRSAELSINRWAINRDWPYNKTMHHKPSVKGDPKYLDQLGTV